MLEKTPFLLRTDVPLDKTSTLVSTGQDILPEAAVAVDFGCGRIATAASNLSDDAWARLNSAASKMDGHTLLEKATKEFALRHDLFGTPRADWDLTHRIKAALDPHHLFALGRLPGRK